MTTTSKAQFALISVYNKESLGDLAADLSSLGIAIIATGNTYKQLIQQGIAATELSDYTNFPEIMDGRVKSLHPKIHGGILARQPQDQETLLAHQIQPIDFVICNLYPFEQTIKQPNCTTAEAIENIDIGGPTMIRAAAKNFNYVTVVTDPSDYPQFLDELNRYGSTSLTTRQHLACKAFQLITHYDDAIARYFLSQIDEDSLTNQLPSRISPQTKQPLRYGENPHQSAASFTNKGIADEGVLQASLIQGKPLSYNNLIDSDATFNIIRSLNTPSPACVIVKHATPCGVALDDDLTQAYLKAYQCDPESAFGGIIGTNQPLTIMLAEKIIQQPLTEVILAPSISIEARTLLQRKPNLRVLCFGDRHLTPPATSQLRSISGGIIAQEPDWQPLHLKDLTWVTQITPATTTQQDAIFAWNVVKHVKSNAIVYAKNKQTLGIGSGQTSRIFSAKIAALRAEQVGFSLSGAIMASDAFFPFSDSVDLAHQHGIKCIIQPGGSKRDAEVISRANELEIAMAFTKVRHFLH